MATTIPIPAFKLGGMQAMVLFLYVVVMFGALHLLAISHPEWRFSKWWLGLGF